MKKTNFLKTLLIAVAAMGGANCAWGEDIVETYDFNAWGQSHMTKNTRQDGPVTGDALFQVNGTNVYGLQITGTKDSEVWDLTDRFAVSNNISYRWGSGGSDVPRLGSENQKGTFYVSIINLKAGDRVVITCSNVLFFSTNATYDVEGTPTAIVKDANVASGTTYTITGDGTQHLDMYMANQTWANITKVVVTRSVACAEPTKVITGAYNNNRKFTLACATDGATIYYSETERVAGAEGWTEYTGEVTTSATTIWAYASKSGGNSDVISFATGAGTTLALNAPTLNVTDFTKSGDTYYPQFTFSSNQASVLGNPAVTYTYTIDGADNSTPNPTSYNETKTGVLIVTAHADGYTSTSAEEVIVLPYNLTKSYDFSQTYTLNANWSDTGSKGMPAGTYDVNGERYNIATEMDVNVKDALISGLTFSQNYYDIYYFVQELGLGYVGGSGHNTTDITVDGLTDNDYTVFKKYYSGTPNTEQNAVVKGNNTWNMGKMAGTGAHILRGIFVYSPDAVSLAIADCKAYDTSAAFATAIDAESFTTVEEVYAFNTTYHIANGVLTDGVRDITGVIRNAAVADATDWGGATINSGEEFTGAPDNTYLDNYNASINTNQTVYGVPAGTYIVKAATRAATGTPGTLYVSDGTSDVGKIDQITNVGNTGGDLGNGWSYQEMTFTLTDTKNLLIGFWANTADSKWAGCDDWHMYKVESVPATITSAGMATYVPAYDLDFSATEIEAYKVKVSTKGVATLTKVDEVPAGTPVLLVKDGGATEDIPVMTGAAAVSDNDLVAGTGAAVATVDGEYTNMILNDGSKGIGFYFAAGQTVATNRAYLHIATTLAPDAAGSRMEIVFEDVVTGIENNNRETITNNRYYNLHGVEVAQPTKGLYIVNGKKVVVK